MEYGFNMWNQYYGQDQMMRLVPQPGALLSTIDFDLDLLDCQVPSPAPPSPFHLASPTMFSAAAGDDKEINNANNANLSPFSPTSSTTSSSSAYSPYSPAARSHRRSSSTVAGDIGGNMMTASSPLNLQESLLEFSQLQDRIKKEQEQLLDSRLSIDLPAFGSSSSFAGQSSSNQAVSAAGRERGQLQDESSQCGITFVPMSSHQLGMATANVSSNNSFRQPAAASAAASSSPTAIRPTPQQQHHLSSPLPSYTHIRRQLDASTALSPQSPDCGSLSVSDPTPTFSIKLEPGTTAGAGATAATSGGSYLDVSLSSSFAAPTSPTTTATGSNSNNGNNTILRQFLQDTSFQAKFNLKPFDLGGGLSGYLTAAATVPEKQSPADGRLKVVDGGASSGFLMGQSTTSATTGGLQERDDRSSASVGGFMKLEEDINAIPGGGLLKLEGDSSASGGLVVKMEPVLDLAVQQVQKDIDTTCEMLSISKDPRQWSRDDVRSWLLWTLQQFAIPMSLVDLDMWTMEGEQFVQMGEEEFRARLPQGGETVYAQFDIWKANAAMNNEQNQLIAAPPPYPSYSGAPGGQNSLQQHSSSCYSDMAYVLQLLDGPPPTSEAMGSANSASAATTFMKMENILSPPSYSTNPLPYSVTTTTPATYTSPPPYPGSSCGGGEMSGLGREDTVTPMDEDDDSDEESGKVSPTSGAIRSATNIHLWQFVKELLLMPNQYGNYIHWVDRSKGVFKIVDSVKVAALWGKRKNRPAMNYDKLSRSLRQYYKKGIMKKTERSQRLVYQFCHPYFL